MGRLTYLEGGGKVFVIGGWDSGNPSFSFKVGEVSFHMLRDQPGLRPAPYLASRGLKWIQHFAAPGLTDRELEGYIGQSYRMIVQALPKRRRAELGLTAPAAPAAHKAGKPAIQEVEATRPRPGT